MIRNLIWNYQMSETTIETRIREAEAMLAGLYEFRDDMEAARNVRRDVKTRNRAITSAAREVADELEPVTFDQVLLVDDLAMVAKWLKSRSRGFAAVPAWFTRHPRVTLLSGVLLGSLAVMFGYATLYFGAI
jgi:hypothetical protein